MRIPILLLLISLISFNAFSQQDPSLGQYQVHGVVKTKFGEVIPGATLYVQKGNARDPVSADTNGDIIFALEPGEYVITASSALSSDFKMFIKIVAAGPNPDNISFILDPSKICCEDTGGKSYPKPLSLPKPAYPPAARAQY